MTTRPDLESNAQISNFLSSKGEENSNKRCSYSFQSFCKRDHVSMHAPAPMHNHIYRKLIEDGLRFHLQQY